MELTTWGPLLVFIKWGAKLFELFELLRNPPAWNPWWAICYEISSSIHSSFCPMEGLMLFLKLASLRVRPEGQGYWAKVQWLLVFVIFTLFGVWLELAILPSFEAGLSLIGFWELTELCLKLLKFSYATDCGGCRWVCSRSGLIFWLRPWAVVTIEEICGLIAFMAEVFAVFI